MSELIGGYISLISMLVFWCIVFKILYKKLKTQKVDDPDDDDYNVALGV